MLARLALALIGMALAFSSAPVLAQPQPAEDPAALKSACELGDAYSCSKLGARRMKTSDALPTSEVLGLFTRACELGDPQGCTNLASWYLRGHGVPKDNAKGYAFGIRACERGMAAGCFAAGIARERLGEDQAHAGEAVRLLDKACGLNHAASCGMLGDAYGTANDPRKAAAYAARACELDKSKCKAATPSTPTATAPFPVNQSFFTIFGVRLGAERFDTVKTMLDRNRASFFDYFEGTTALNEATRKVVARRLVVMGARFPGIGPSGARVWFDFVNEADPILSTVTVIYARGTQGRPDERIAALTRQYGASDGKGNPARWHRIVPGADIALFADLQTGGVDEFYTYSRAQPSAAAPVRGACPAVKVTYAPLKGATDKVKINATPVVEEATYNWKTNAGTIDTGQGSASIILSLPSGGESALVELEVSDDPSCGDQVRKASVTAKLP
jgi:hypothetical protein